VPASGECALSIAASTEEEAAAGEDPVLPERGSLAATLEEPDTRAWPGNLREICTEADLKLELEEPALPEQPIALTMVMRGEALAQQRAHGDGEHDGLYSNAFAEAGMKAGIALGFSDEPPETSTEALPTMKRELGTPLPAGNTLAKLASAPRPPAPIRPWAESTKPEWLAIAAKILYAGSDSSSDGAFEAAAETSVDLTSWQDSDLDSFDVDLSDATGCAGRLEDAPQALAPIVEETGGGIAALAPAGDKRAGVDDAAALEAAADPADTTEDETAVDDDCPEPDWLKEATRHFEAHAVSSSGDGAPVEEKANIFFKEEAAPVRAWGSAEHSLPPAPAQLHSSSCAFPALSSMASGGVCMKPRLTRPSLLAKHWSAASRPTATTRQAGGAPMGPEQRSPTTSRTRPTRTRSPAAFLSPPAARPATRPLARSRQASWRAGTARPAATRRRGRWRDLGRRTQAGVHEPPARRRGCWRALGRRHYQAREHGPPARRRGRRHAFGRRQRAGEQARPARRRGCWRALGRRLKA